MNKKERKSLRIQIEYVKAFIIAIVIISLVVPIATKAYFQDIYELSVGGQVIGYALSKEEIDDSYKAARLRKAKESNELVIVEVPLDVTLVKGNKLKAAVGNELVDIIYSQLDDLMESRKMIAYTIKINDYIATLATKEAILEVLERAQAAYDLENRFKVEYSLLLDKGTGAYGIEVTSASTVEKEIVSLYETIDGEQSTNEGQAKEDTKEVASEDGILTVDFKEDIEVIETYVQPETISTIEEIVTELTTARAVPDKYEVKAGDSLSAIALRHEMTLEELVAQNEGLDVESYILIGDELNVIVPKTEVSVLVDEQKTYEESYSVSTQYINDSSLYVGNDVVIQEASKGQRVVTAIVSYNNGNEYNREIINQEVIIEAKPKIIHRGTKTIPTYMVPLSNPRVTSNFGARWGRQHSGIDYGCPTGTAVFASRGGTILRAGWIGTYGYCIYVDHGDGVVTRYAHLSKILVSPGEYIKQGQKIGLSGNTGNSTGPHLHFEIRIDGQAKDPRKYLN